MPVTGTNFHLAPPSRIVDGLLAVPIDIGAIEARFTLDGGSETAEADATITFIVGPEAGNPIFDLRQEITEAWLDGVSFPVSHLLHHDFGGTLFTDLRVIDAVLGAGSVHTLRVRYNLSVPDAELNPGYLPVLEWSPGPGLTFAFGLSDLNKARYLEAWLPANLIFDQYAISLEIRIINTMAPHSVITNGTITTLGTNHWQIVFPDRFTALSPLLEVRRSDTLVMTTGTVTLPVSGKTVTIEAWKPAQSDTDLASKISDIGFLLIDNEQKYGAYIHDDRFVAFFNGSGGMEYEGGVTSSSEQFVLSHETFHSWFARGIKPASQADGWWDEGFACFHDEGASTAVPFDYSDPVFLLCSRDPWQRSTPGNSYSDGKRFWEGLASLLSPAVLNTIMKNLYDTYKGRPVSTGMIEENLLSHSGSLMVVDSFHRFVYGLPDPSPPPDLWFRDNPNDPGTDYQEGIFWDSPDLWVRNADDGGTEHQPPVPGQDNWFYARVNNKNQAGAAQHFVVTFHPKGFAGTEFIFPGDFFPCTAARAEFDLEPGESRIVRAMWPGILVPPEETKTCILASVLTRSGHPAANSHVWEQNCLAQKNVVVKGLGDNEFFIVPIVITNASGMEPVFDLEIWRSESMLDMEVSLIHRSRSFFSMSETKVRMFRPDEVVTRPLDSARMECGCYIPRGSSQGGKKLNPESSDLATSRFSDGWVFQYPEILKAKLLVKIKSSSQSVVGLMIRAPSRVKKGKAGCIHFVQRNLSTGIITGGVTVKVHRTGREKSR